MRQRAVDRLRTGLPLLSKKVVTFNVPALVNVMSKPQGLSAPAKTIESSTGSVTTDGAVAEAAAGAVSAARSSSGTKRLRTKFNLRFSLLVAKPHGAGRPVLQPLLDLAEPAQQLVEAAREP